MKPDIKNTCPLGDESVHCFDSDGLTEAGGGGITLFADGLSMSTTPCLRLAEQSLAQANDLCCRLLSVALASVDAVAISRS